MKLNVKNIKEIPGQYADGQFGVCIYGEAPDNIKEWIKFHNLKTSPSVLYTNIFLEGDLLKLFEDKLAYDYVDGFSPNTNKHLHLGHISNLVLAKSFQSLGIGKKFIANLGDTLTGEVSKKEALKEYYKICAKFEYNLDKVYFASELNDELELVDGINDYEGTKIFEIGDKKIVGKKSSGATTYFYQDVCLAKKLNASTLYLTGAEQSEHFGLLKEMFPSIDHLPLGLVTLNGKKMSSSEGNVILFSEVLNILKEEFEDDKLAWNVLCGYILKSAPSSKKNINLDNLKNPKESQGLYLSYTLAKLKSAGLEIEEKTKFNDIELNFKLLKAKNLLQPNVLWAGVYKKAVTLSLLYEHYKIKDVPENHKIFAKYAEDLLLGMKLLGLFNIDKV